MAVPSAPAAAQPLRRTPLAALCQQHGGRMVPFEGWEMPVQFKGLIEEHKAVRGHCGVFDISHMGVLLLQGDGVKESLQRLVPSDLGRIGPGEALYTVLLNDAGGIRDDLIVYDKGRVDAAAGPTDTLLLVINAGCAEADTAWIRSQLAADGVAIEDRKVDGVLLALQGPEAPARLEALAGESLAGLPRFGHRDLVLAGSAGGAAAGTSVFVARTGYTGEDGFELLLDRQAGLDLWEQLLAEGVSPCGLGARDTLRLEAAMHLYGSDMDATTTPLEASLGWLVHLEMPADFIGRAALESQTATGVSRRLVGLKLQGRAIARHGYPVLQDGQVVGEVTSGTWSPTLEEAIALAYVPATAARPGTELAVEVRGRTHPAVVVKRPFYRRP
ncbi:glycine cleavage system aminomethyltransferase GcvT [Synechococcus sp. CS-1324]|uniref:glycine cleavage system aminomethyltransferase GcvT n=1 Tax=unclassified Synechococcus TaxID=2626047 RepID=UPI000DB85667|nr:MULTISPECIES: glycine cleavage system aminomethyltransferase GcvT [unclassified Synechococcus]MCT0212404.1 glycine cleavage system aminomethyltransferase GcvT [Synechococcus sp. CS-1326]MCT0229353.1 glycine cleavage system aminomethyltransferase GcvT [Synechococcus sp. CS-1324]MCT0234587.1 glycine cleavage system aminomethyltransferase GcvT [Synechococcus sp. CS-1327]PZV01257.1 MAG: glycine cleavage system aminomethyltransferase GcvT [Cyanobium sp.]